MTARGWWRVGILVWVTGITLNCVAVAVAGPGVLWAILGTAMIGAAVNIWHRSTAEERREREAYRRTGVQS